MKKILLVSAAVLVLLCAGCGKKQQEEPDTLNKEELVTASTQELTYKNESYTLRFTKDDEGIWQWKDDTTLPLDQDMMQGLLDQVSALNVLTAVETAEDISAYDLEAADRTLEIKNSDGTALSLQIGAAADGGGYYMTRDGDTAKVFIAPDSLVQMMDRSIYELVEIPVLPTPAADKLTHIEAQSGETAVTVVKGEGESWLCGGTDVAAELAELTAALAEGLKLEACVDYNPSSGALPICGLTEPAVTVTVNYRGDTGSPAAFTLKIGSAYADGYYAMYNDVPAIFKVSAQTAELLKGLTALAG